RGLLELLLQWRELLALEADEGGALVGLLVRAEVARAVGDHPLPVRIDAGLELLDESRWAVDGLSRSALGRGCATDRARGRERHHGADGQQRDSSEDCEGDAHGFHLTRVGLRGATGIPRSRDALQGAREL